MYHAWAIVVARSSGTGFDHARGGRSSTDDAITERQMARDPGIRLQCRGRTSATATTSKRIRIYTQVPDGCLKVHGATSGSTHTSYPASRVSSTWSRNGVPDLEDLVLVRIVGFATASQHAFKPFGYPTRMIASISPAVVCSAASAAGSYPRSHSAVDVRGSMLASRACRNASP